jgi:hypothetical protein
VTPPAAGDGHGTIGCRSSRRDQFWHSRGQTNLPTRNPIAPDRNEVKDHGVFERLGDIVEAQSDKFANSRGVAAG